MGHRARCYAAAAAAAALLAPAIARSWPATVLNVTIVAIPAALTGFCLAVADVGRPPDGR